MNDPLRIAAYCRVSTDKEEQTSSLLAQQTFFEEYAEKNNCQLVKLYTDEGKSGTKFKNRTAFRAMMEDAKRGLFDCVYVKDVSRLARNVVDFLQSVRTLKAMGIDCRFITSNMSLSDGELTLTILAAVAQEESANLSKRVKFGKKKNADQGKVPNFVFGYDKTDGDIFHLVINDEEASTVRRIFRLYLDGYGTYKIADLLNREKKTTKRKFPFSQNAVLRILRNQIYIGNVINGKEEVCDFLTGRRKKNEKNDWHIKEDAVAPIISPQTYYAVQKMLRAKSKSIHTTENNSPHLFSSLIACPKCGSPFRLIVRKYQNTYYKWVCRGRNQYGITFCDNNLVICEDTLFNEIMQHLKHQIPNLSDFFENIKKRCIRLYKTSITDRDITSLLRQKNNLENLRKRKIALFDADILTICELKEENQKILKEIKAIEQEIQTSSKQEREKNIETFCDNLLTIDNLFSKTFFKNTVLQKMIAKITADQNGIEVIFNKLT